ncbi:potassium-transporting ATPase subunit KdpC [Desertivirga arenae]|uniref:potassium-transporting ATPase subunit KdpC n=1 Tax=Desertivirga arenae TaxID=2810309 RepID=UPI001A96B356|nr:potassium-transporting ATPase subunit KdpC [Pedobacter sp. SYSU D00823]
MKSYIFQSIRLTLVLLVLLCVIYPVSVAFVAKFSKGAGKGEQSFFNRKVVGYKAVGQSFSDPRYFWGRPSAVSYNAAGSAGSNKGPSNPDYLKEVKSRVDTLLKYHPYAERKDIPADLVTASGSGLDPNISVEAADLQVRRVAELRGFSLSQIQELVIENTEAPFLGFLGPRKVNVLQLNIALDQISTYHEN